MLDRNLLKILQTDEPSIQELRNIAKKLGIRLRRSMKKREIIKEIKKNALLLEKEGVISIKTDNKKIEKKSNSSINLKDSYNKDKLNLLEINPHNLFVFWDFSLETRLKLEYHMKKEGVYLRINQLENDEINRIMETKIDFLNEKKVYIKVPVENSYYFAEIGIKENCVFTPIIKSIKVKTSSQQINKVNEEKWLSLKDNKVEVVKVNKEQLTIEKINVNDNLFADSSLLVKNNINSGGGAFIWTLVNNNGGV